MREIAGVLFISSMGRLSDSRPRPSLARQGVSAAHLFGSPWHTGDGSQSVGMLVSSRAGEMPANFPGAIPPAPGSFFGGAV